MPPEHAALHRPHADPLGERLRRRVYLLALALGTPLMAAAVAVQALGGGSDPFLRYVAPVLVALGVLDIWWLLSGRSLRFAERVGTSVLALTTLIHIALLSAGPTVNTGYPNSGPYWTVATVCALGFLAFPERWGRRFAGALLLAAALLPWLIGGPYAYGNPLALLHVQASAAIVVLLFWGLAWFRGQHAHQAHTHELLRELAFKDVLTELPNRRAVYPAVDALLAGVREGRGGALLLVDLDHFKRVNDEHGHGAGDEVLIQTARLLAQCEAESGADPPTVGRWGGEEFIVVMPGASPARARQRADALRGEFHRSAWPGGLRVTVSVGGAAAQPGDDFRGLLARADQALYHAKHAGRDRAVIAGAPAHLPEPVQPPERVPSS